MTIKETFTNRETLQPGPIPRFVLPKLVLILIAHLLLNIKKKKKKKTMQNQGYIILLA
jgi:hypothetical protein